MGLTYENAVPTSMIGASNHFQGAIATAAMLYGLSTGAALATVVGVLIAACQVARSGPLRPTCGVIETFDWRRTGDRCRRAD